MTPNANSFDLKCSTWICSNCHQQIEVQYNFCWGCGGTKAAAASNDLSVADPSGFGKVDSSTYSLRDFAQYAQPRQKYFLLASAVFELHFWMFFAAALLLLVPAFIEQGILVLASPVVPLMLGSVELFARFRRRFRVNAVAAIQNAKQEPILYLRSFYFERLDKSPTLSHEGEIELYEKENDDEVLAIALRQAGPLIAVGAPNTSIPPLGSIRLFFKDNEWQHQVARLMTISQLVIIQPGYSDGTEWEIKVAKERVEPEKLIYSFLAWQHLTKDSKQLAYELFAMQVKRIYGCDLPLKIAGAYFLYFSKRVDPNGEKWIPHMASVPELTLPLFWFLKAPSLIWRVLTAHAIPYPLDVVPRFLRRLPVPRVFRKYNAASVREALRPVVKKRGTTLPAWRTAAFFLVVFGITSGLIYTKVHYGNPTGRYEITAYDEGNEKLFEGELVVIAEPFKGTSTLNILSLGMKPDCFTTEEIASRRIIADIHSEMRWNVFRQQDTYLVFRRKSSKPWEWPLAEGYLSDEKLYKSGSWFLSHCFERGTHQPGDWRIRRKMPWDNAYAAMFGR